MFKKYWDDFVKTSKTLSGALTIILVVGTLIYMNVDEDMFNNDINLPGYHVESNSTVPAGKLNVTTTINNESISVSKIDENSPILDLVDKLNKM
jgi:hypothetical protein